MKDRTNDTFYRAYHMLLQLICRYPYAQIIVMASMHRCGEEDMPCNTVGVSRQSTLNYYVYASGTWRCLFYCVPVVDLFAESGIQPQVEFLREMHVRNGLHPNDVGHVKIARCLLRTLDRL